MTETIRLTVAQAAATGSTRQARHAYEQAKRRQRSYL